MRITTLFNKLLNLQGLWVTDVRFEHDSLVIRARPRHRLLTCPHCGSCKRGRMSTTTRRWRHLGIWGRDVWIETEIRRLRCEPCGRVVTEDVPWARHGSQFTRPFEDAVALMVQKTNKTAVSMLFGIAWTTVGNIAERVVQEHLDPDRLVGLRRIGIDEVSFRKRHRYLSVVTDHDRKRVVWVGEGHSAAALQEFFDLLGPEGCAAIEIATIDMAAGYRKAVTEKLPNAQIVFDHFHVARLANEAVNKTRRQLMRAARQDEPRKAQSIKNLRWPLLHRRHRASEPQLAAVGILGPAHPLGRAYLLKESLLDILSGPADVARERIRRWMGWASRCRLPAFVNLGRTVRQHLRGILAILEHRVTNARSEGINNKIRLLSHRAFGFHSAPPLIATVYLTCGGIQLPELQLL